MKAGVRQRFCRFTDDARAFGAACGFVARGAGVERVVGAWLQDASRK